MIILLIDEILKLHEWMIEATGGAAGVRDVATLESAVYHAFATFEGNDLYPSLEEKAARQAYAIIRNQPFVDGNKRTGLYVMLVFLELNNIRLSFTQPELVKIGLGIADCSIGADDILQWILKHRQE